MSLKNLPLGLAAMLFMATIVTGCAGIALPPVENSTPESSDGAVIHPAPRAESSVSVEEALRKWRSVRVYAGVPLALADIGQILWAAQGVTDERGYRAAPSAGALYPLEVYVVAGDVTDLAPGVYHYHPEEHLLTRINGTDRRIDLEAAAIDQAFVGDAPATLVIAAIPERMTAKYGDRGIRYVDMEAGHAAENIYLQATASSLGTVAIGAFDDDRVREILMLPANTTPLYLMPVGKIISGSG